MQRRDNSNTHVAALVLLVVLDPRVVALSLAILLAVVRVVALCRDDDDPHISVLAIALVGVLALRVLNMRRYQANNEGHVATIVLVLDPVIAARGLAIILLIALHTLNLVLALSHACLSSMSPEFWLATTRIVRDVADKYQQH